jgi:hypothetical protein
VLGSSRATRNKPSVSTEKIAMVKSQYADSRYLISQRSPAECEGVNRLVADISYANMDDAAEIMLR